MGRNSGKQDTNEDRNVSETKRKLEDDVDVLFRLPLAEFTASRNTLAARLKKSARGPSPNQGHSPGVSGTQRRGAATASHRAAKP